MTTSATDTPETGETPQNDANNANNGIAMRLDYAEPSQVVSQVVSQTISQAVSESAQTLNDRQAEQYIDHVALFAQLNRPAVVFHAKVTQPLLFRDCLLALFDIVRDRKSTRLNSSH